MNPLNVNNNTDIVLCALVVLYGQMYNFLIKFIHIVHSSNNVFKCVAISRKAHVGV